MTKLTIVRQFDLLFARQRVTSLFELGLLTLNFRQSRRVSGITPNEMKYANPVNRLLTEISDEQPLIVYRN